MDWREFQALQESMARTREIDRLGEARDVQGLLRMASEHAQVFSTYNCGTWLSRSGRLCGCAQERATGLGEGG